MAVTNSKVISKVIVQKDDQTILLLKRSLTDLKGPGEWDLPGGTVDDDEDFTEAARRELEEESGIKLAHKDLDLIYARSGSFERGNRCWLFFVAKMPDDQTVVLSEEHESQQWLDLETASRLILFQEQQLALAYFQENILAR